MAKEEYRFKVEQNGIVKMQTNEEACMYNKEIRNGMREAGCKIYKDGKLWKE